MNAEETLLGMNHCQAGEVLVAQWNLSEGLREVVSNHHKTPDSATSPAILLIHVCCRLSDCLGFGANTAEHSTIEEILEVATPEVAHAVEDELPELNVNLVRELNSLRLC